MLFINADAALHAGRAQNDLRPAVLRTTKEGSVVLEFSGKKPWVDRAPALSQTAATAL
ncbi:MAG: hypothetical protein ACREUD_00540 [Gammaproteobacteria bacterium]